MRFRTWCALQKLATGINKEALLPPEKMGGNTPNGWGSWFKGTTTGKPEDYPGYKQGWRPWSIGLNPFLSQSPAGQQEPLNSWWSKGFPKIDPRSLQTGPFLSESKQQEPLNSWWSKGFPKVDPQAIRGGLIGKSANVRTAPGMLNQQAIDSAESTERDSFVPRKSPDYMQQVVDDEKGTTTAKSTLYATK